MTYRLYIFYFSFAVYCFATHAHAATLYFDPVHTSAPIKGVGEVTLLLNPELEHINAVEGVITFPAELIEVTRVSLQNSIIPFWVEEPNVQEGLVHFSGIIPNGFNGLREAYATERKSGIVLTLEYRGIGEGTGAFSVEDAQVFLNDGNATRAVLSTVPADLTIQASEGTQNTEDEVDVIPPERFPVYITNDSSLAGSQWFAVFSTVDKGSGVAYYEVAEAEKGVEDNIKWNRATSPYILQDQTRSKDVRVRAIDHAGNVREADTATDFLSSDQQLPLSKRSDTGILAVALLVLVGAVFFILYVHKRRRA